jgi:hypothetical protein
MKKNSRFYFLFSIFSFVILFSTFYFLDSNIVQSQTPSPIPAVVEISAVVEVAPLPTPTPPPPPPPPAAAPPPPAIETQVILQGVAHPLSRITVLQDGRVIGIVTADALANFRKEIANIAPGIWTFGIWAEDTEGRRSRTHSFTTNIRAGMITTINGIFLPPTISLDRTVVPRGETLNILGMTAPESNVSIFIDSPRPIIRQTQARVDGIWLYALDTALLEEGSHSARARAVDPDGLRSVDSQLLAFTVGRAVPEVICPRADLNRDGRVNLIDFSILLFWWGRFDPCPDQNQDGRVNLIDFSIMMYHWTG